MITNRYYRTLLPARYASHDGEIQPLWVRSLLIPTNLGSINHSFTDPLPIARHALVAPVVGSQHFTIFTSFWQTLI